MFGAKTCLIFAFLFFVKCEQQQQYNTRTRHTTSPTTSPPFHDRTAAPRNGDVEYRLNRLEGILVEKIDSIRFELRDVSRRLQTLEWQSAETQSSLDTFRSDLGRVSQQVSGRYPPQGNIPSVEARVDNLATGIQILVVATRGLTSEVNFLKKNVSSLIKDSRSVLQLTPDLVTKQFFNNGLQELKQQVQPWGGPSGGCPKNGNSTNLPRNCKEVLESGYSKSGIYSIQPDPAGQAFMVVCDLQTRGGGWTIIHNRYDGSQDFYQNWHEYKHGFGNLGGEFWLGLENIHQLTGSGVNELLIELQDLDLDNRSAYYSAFSIGSEVEGYSLKVLGGYGGDAGDSLIYHAGSRFSTKDMDQDNWPEGSCAQAHGGAWWYRSCDKSNLNGKYLTGELPAQYVYQGMYWDQFKGSRYSLLRAKMLVRPREQINTALVDEIFDKNLSGVRTERNNYNNNPGRRFD